MGFPVIGLVSLVAQYAPGLVRRLAGRRAGEVADKVAGVAKTLTGASSVEEAMAKVAADADLAIQLRLQLAQLDLDEEKLEIEDRNSARQRDIEVRKLAKGQNRRADAMLAMAFLAVVAIAILLALGKVDGATGVGGFLITIGGMFARNIGSAFDFEFGSSRGSKEKDQLLGKLASGE